MSHQHVTPFPLPSASQECLRGLAGLRLFELRLQNCGIKALPAELLGMPSLRVRIKDCPCPSWLRYASQRGNAMCSCMQVRSSAVAYLSTCLRWPGMECELMMSS